MSETTQPKTKDEASDKSNGSNGKKTEPKSEVRAKDAAPPPAPETPEPPPPPPPAAASPAPASAAQAPAPDPAAVRRTRAQLMAKVAQLPEDKQKELDDRLETIKTKLSERLGLELQNEMESVLREAVGEAPAPVTPAPATAPAPAAAPSAPAKMDLSKKSAGPAPAPAKPARAETEDPHDFYAGMLQMDEPPPSWTEGAIEAATYKTNKGRAYASADGKLVALRDRPGRDPVFFFELMEGPTLCASVEGKPVQAKAGTVIQFEVTPSLVGLKGLYQYAEEHRGHARVKIRPLGPSALFGGKMAYAWRAYPDENEPHRPKLYPIPAAPQE